MHCQSRAEWMREVNFLLKENGYAKFLGKNMNLAATAFILGIDRDQVRDFMTGRPCVPHGKHILFDKAEVFEAYKAKSEFAEIRGQR